MTYERVRFSRMLDFRIEVPTDPAIPIQDETTAWVNEVVENGGTVSASRQTIVNELIYYLKQDGIWDKLDRLWLFAAENEPSALTDLVGLALATNVNSTTFTVNEGYTGNGSNMEIDTNYVIGAGNYTQNSACAFGWNNTAGQDDGGLFGVSGAIIRLFPEFTDSNSYWDINASAGNSAAHDAVSGLYLINRTASDASAYDVNGSEIDTAASTSSSTTGDEFRCLYGFGGGEFSNREISAFGCGGGLSSGERAAIYTRLDTYMTAVGL